MPPASTVTVDDPRAAKGVRPPEPSCSPLCSVYVCANMPLSCEQWPDRVINGGTKTTALAPLRTCQ